MGLKTKANPHCHQEIITNTYKQKYKPFLSLYATLKYSLLRKQVLTQIILDIEHVPTSSTFVHKGTSTYVQNKKSIFQRIPN